jgi:hypothetical protein
MDYLKDLFKLKLQIIGLRIRFWQRHWRVIMTILALYFVMGWARGGRWDLALGLTGVLIVLFFLYRRL